MNDQPVLPSAELEKIRVLDTCTVSNAIERLNVRLRNEGFVFGAVRCRFSELRADAGLRGNWKGPQL
jgi:hypothetical protein